MIEGPPTARASPLATTGVTAALVAPRRYSAEVILPLAGEKKPSLDQVFESIGDYAVFTMDKGGVVTMCNPGVERLLGYSREEFVGKRAEIIFTHEDRLAQAPECEAELARITGRAVDDRWHVGKDGKRIWANGIMTDLRDEAGEFIGYVKVLADRTQERQIQDALQESEARYRSLLDDVLDTSTVGVFILDASFKVVWLNRAVERYFRLRREEAIGIPKEELVRSHLVRFVDEPGDFSERLLEAYREGADPARFEVHVRAEDGRDEYWLEHRSQTIASGPFAGGRIEHYYDITDRKRSERALAEARDELESQVRERTADLLALNDELESFNYSVSHDLRAPLRGLAGFSQILLEEYREGLDERGQHYLTRVSAAAERMGELIDALLALSRVSRSELRISDVDLSGLVDGIAKALCESEPDRVAEFAVQPDVVARGDERLLQVALENLLGNAWKFSRDQELTRIAFGAELRDGRPVYFVRDNGAGFDMAFVGKLFEPFQRLHSPRNFSGMGIGLATVQRIIHRHGGKVWGEGETGKGASFYFTLAPDSAFSRPERVD
jgi:PAS domain S-box-containing protein